MEFNAFKLLIYIFLVSANVIYGLRSGRRSVSLKCNDRIHLNLGDLLTFLLLVFLVGLVVMDHDNPDYGGYCVRYNSDLTGTTDVGYEILMTIGQKLGLSFDAFRGGIYALFFSLVWISVKRLKLNQNITLGLYALFPFTYDAIQIRFFLSFVMVFFSLPYLLEKGKKPIVKFIICICLATMLHSVAFIYGSFLLVRTNGKEKIWQRFLVFILSVSLVLMSYSLFHPNSVFRMILVNAFVSNASEIKVRNYLGFSWKATIMLISQELLFLFTASMSKKMVESSLNKDDRGYKLAQMIYGCNLVISCTLPLLLVTPQFLRLFRNLTLLNNGLPGIIQESNANQQNKTIGNTMFLISFLSILLWNFYMGDSTQEVFWVFFNDV